MISYTDRSSLSIFQFDYDLLTGFDADSEYFFDQEITEVCHGFNIFRRGFCPIYITK